MGAYYRDTIYDLTDLNHKELCAVIQKLLELQDLKVVRVRYGYGEDSTLIVTDIKEPNGI
jgi:hypothetical protein